MDLLVQGRLDDAPLEAEFSRKIPHLPQRLFTDTYHIHKDKLCNRKKIVDQNMSGQALSGHDERIVARLRLVESTGEIRMLWLIWMSLDAARVLIDEYQDTCMKGDVPVCPDAVKGKPPICPEGSPMR